MRGIISPADQTEGISMKVFFEKWKTVEQNELEKFHNSTILVYLEQAEKT